jgi:hypothetical protein
MRVRDLALGVAFSVVAPVTTVYAFCGFYVGGAGRELYSDATMVVLMRDGRHTVLAMRNDYAGPPEDFAMVVPVPHVLGEEDVKTLPREVFDKIEELSAPRLVEYWEEEPFCAPPGTMMGWGTGGGFGMSGVGGMVRVEAQFAVGEYDIVILGADDSSALETWLRREGYAIPADAAALLRPYIEAGTKFFVAKVDVSRLAFENGAARLSPLRIHYEDDELRLPVRLGLANSPGRQDLLVHVLAADRYETANYPNVFIPTNVVVRNYVKRRFAGFYASLFDRTLEQNPGSVVTEYAWSAGSCDPCPGPTLDATDVLTLGGDVVPSAPSPWALTLTRLHYRYDAGALGDDLVFRVAQPVQGGTGTPDERGNLVQGVREAHTNTFQARYAVLHRHWPPAPCAGNRIHRGWGGPSDGRAERTLPALDTAKVRARRPGDLERMIRRPIPELGLVPRSLGEARPARTEIVPGALPSAAGAARAVGRACTSARRC